MTSPSLVAIISLCTSLMVFVTAVLAYVKSKKVHETVQHIEMNVNGRLSELLANQVKMQERVNQLTAALETSDTDVPPESIVMDMPVDVTTLVTKEDQEGVTK